MPKKSKIEHREPCESCGKKFTIRNNQIIRREKLASILILIGGILAIILFFVVSMMAEERLPFVLKMLVMLPGLVLFLLGWNKPKLRIVTCPYCKYQVIHSMKVVKTGLSDLPIHNNDKYIN